MRNMKPWLFKILATLPALSLAFAVSAAPVFAADAYPSRPVRLIIPFTPGDAVDRVARLIADKLSERLGKRVIGENFPGAGGRLAFEMAAKAAPDGYTILEIAANYPINAAIYNDLPFDPVKSFTPIAKLATGPSVLVVHPSVPANSVKELIALMKQKPGQLIWAAAGVGGNQHLAAELFKSKTGTDFKIVQFKGGSAMWPDILGGHSHIATSTLAAVLSHIKAGKLKVLGNCALKRSDILPDVPTVSESGVPGYEVTGWFGLLAPAGTPAPIISRLTNEVKGILNTDEVNKLFRNEGSQVDYLGPSEFGAYVEQEITKWREVVKEANIKIQ